MQGWETCTVSFPVKCLFWRTPVARWTTRGVLRNRANDGIDGARRGTHTETVLMRRCVNPGFGNHCPRSVTV